MSGVSSRWSRSPSSLLLFISYPRYEIMVPLPRRIRTFGPLLISLIFFPLPSAEKKREKERKKKTTKKEFSGEMGDGVDNRVERGLTVVCLDPRKRAVQGQAQRDWSSW